MPLPLKAKTWEFTHGSNSLSGVHKTDLDAAFIIAKNALKTGTTPCTVVGSCNGTTATLDGVDRITASANIVNAAEGSPHSWIVLNLVGMGSSQVAFLWNTSLDQISIVVSPGGLFTGGTATASPTATDSQTILGPAQWAGSFGAGGGQYRIHVMRSTDGKNTRVFFCGNSNVLGCWSFETVANAVAGWLTPYAFSANGASGNVTDTTICNATTWLGTTKYKSKGYVANAMDLFTTDETAQGGGHVYSRLALPNEISGEYPICPVGLWHDTTVGQRGRHGSIPDMYFTGAGPVMGDTYPADGSKQFQQMGQMIVPSDGTAWLIS